MGWEDVVAPRHPLCRAAPEAFCSPPGWPEPSNLHWGGANAEQSTDEVRGEAAPEGTKGIKMMQQSAFNYVNEGSQKGRNRQRGARDLVTEWKR